MSVTNWQPMRHDIPEEQRHKRHCGGGLKYCADK
jgi:hypothetical protein